MGSQAELPKVDSMDTTQGNRFAPYGPENHSAPLWIISLLGVVYSFGVLMIRIFIKRRVFGWDDSLIVVATVSSSGAGCVQNLSLLTTIVDGARTSYCLIQGTEKWSRLNSKERIRLEQHRKCEYGNFYWVIYFNS